MKKYLCLIFALIMVLGLCACGHKHTWVEATCTEPKTCSECGETEGEPLGHDWIEATLTEPMKCSRCGITQGQPYIVGIWQTDDKGSIWNACNNKWIIHHTGNISEFVLYEDGDCTLNFQYYISPNSYAYDYVSSGRWKLTDDILSIKIQELYNGNHYNVYDFRIDSGSGKYLLVDQNYPTCTYEKVEVSAFDDGF